MRSCDRLSTRSLLSAAALILFCGLAAWADNPSPPATSTQAAPAPKLDAPVAVNEASPPAAEQLAQGDPSGSKTGTINDVPASDSQKGLTLGDALNQVGQNKVAINFVWTLIAGFMVMFMQAGFAFVETGLCRAKNANHTMMMNFMVYGFGLFAY
jgi:Amt family ammonium transporter